MILTVHMLRFGSTQTELLFPNPGGSLFSVKKAITSRVILESRPDKHIRFTTYQERRFLLLARDNENRVPLHCFIVFSPPKEK